jgi:hypothetical protein
MRTVSTAQVDQIALDAAEGPDSAVADVTTVSRERRGRIKY